MTFQQLKHQESNNVVVHGPPGSGKTYMLGSLIPLLEKEDRVALLDFRAGTNAIYTYARKNKIPEEAIDHHFMITKPKNFDDTVKAFVDVSQGVNASIVKYTVLDNITEMQRIFFSEIRSQKYTKKTKEEVILPGNKADQDDWGILRFRMLEIVNAFAELPCKTIFTAQYDDRSERPLLDGRTTATDIMSVCDVILRLAIIVKASKDWKQAKITRLCYAEPIDGAARDRDEYLTGAFEPDYGYIFQQLNPTKQEGERSWETH